MTMLLLLLLLHAGRVEVLMGAGPSKGLTQTLALQTMVTHPRNRTYKEFNGRINSMPSLQSAQARGWCMVLKK